MNHLLFNRSTGALAPGAFTRIQTSQRISSIAAAPGILFNGGERETVLVNDNEESLETPRTISQSKTWAHQSGVSALALDIEGRILLSGGADSTIKLWDLDNSSNVGKHVFMPAGSVSRSATTHKFGITSLCFYPFDSAAFLSSSYDHHLKLYSTDSLAVSADFDLGSIIYCHALSPIADHLLVALATQHPTVRLVDLRSGSSISALAGHHGAILSLSWSPTMEHVLASGSIDGTVRLWDIRKSSGSLGTLDLENSLGITGTDGLGRGTPARQSSKAHSGAVNAISFTDDGSFLVTAGHDERIRVWDASTGANTLVSFGPTVKNNHLSTLPLATTPTTMTDSGKSLLFYPNENELLVFELHEGRLLKRLKVPGPAVAAVRARTGERNIKNRITGLVWRDSGDGVVSSHTDGQIRAWLPRTTEDDMLDKEEEASAKRQHNDDNDDIRKKRQVLNDVFRDLTQQKISFG